MTAEQTEKELKRQLRSATQHLKELTSAVGRYLVLLDEEMKQPSDAERGKRIAKLSNALEMANDRARYFGLHIDYRTDRKRKERARKQIIKPAAP